MKNADLPAMPISAELGAQWLAGTHTFSGLTKREYFMAHAPEPPEWFEPVMSEQKPTEAFSDPAANRWLVEYKRQRYLQWPGVWADAILSK